MAATLTGCASFFPLAKHDGEPEALSNNSTVPRPTRWKRGIPVDVPRGELLAATVPGEAIAQLLPGVPQPSIRLVSGAVVPAGYEITNIGGQEIRHCGDLHAALERVIEEDASVQVDLIPSDSGAGATEVATQLTGKQLLSVSTAIRPEHHAYKVSEGGNPAFIIRDGGLRAQLVLRVERSRGLAHLVLDVANCWGSASPFPVEVMASSGGESLRCLTVADTLEVLYGDPEQHPLQGTESFARTSQREDYLLPVNYERLSTQSDARARRESMTSAFASIAGIPYPGDVLLGDARALTGIFMQQQMLRAGEHADASWIVFHGPSLATAQHIDVSIDFGNGLNTFRFMIPANR